MPMRITMLQTRNGEAGVGLLVTGSTYTVSDAFGAQMVGSKWATDTDGVLTPPVSSLTPAAAAAVQAAADGVGSISRSALSSLGIGTSSMSASMYRRLQAALRPSNSPAAAAVTYYVDANRGSDANAGTTLALPLQTIAAAAAKSLVAGSVVALANDSIFSLTNRVSFTAGGSAGNPVLLTNYDPTGDFPSQLPIITWNYKPTSGDWTWDGARSAWYYTNPNARSFTRHAYVRIAGLYWGISFGSTYGSLTTDYRFAADDTNKRLYLYAPPGINPTTYYGGPNSVVIGECQGGAITVSGVSNFVVENLRGAELGYLVHTPNFSGANTTGIELRNLSVDLAAGCTYTEAGDSFNTSVRVIGCAATRIGSSAFRLERSSYRCLISHCSTIDGNNNNSIGGSVYLNEYSGTATAPRGGNIIQYNYARDIKSGIGDHPFDGSGFYAEQRGSALWLANIVENTAVAFQDNSGSKNSFVANLVIDANLALLGSDSSAIGGQSITFDNNTVLFAKNRNLTQGSGVPTTGLVHTQGGGAGKSVKARGNVMVADGLGGALAAFRVAAGTSVDFSGNSVPQGLPNFALDGTTPIPASASTKYMGSQFDDVGSLAGVAAAGSTDLLGQAIASGSRRGCLV